MVVVGLLAGLAACRRTAVDADPGWTPQAPAGLGPIVARVGAAPIFAEDVRRRQLVTGGGARQALDDLVRFELLAQAARDRGIPLPPAPKEALVQVLLERDFETQVRLDDVPEKELRTIYERFSDTWVHSRLVEVGVLSIYTGARMKPEARSRARESANQLKAHLEKLPPATLEDFSAIARDPAWAGRRVQYVRQWQSDRRPFSAKVGAEVQKLTRPGQTTPLVEDEMGFHIARYIAERPPKNEPFQVARQEILKELHPRWRKERFSDFVARIAQGQRAYTFPDALANVRPGS